MRLGLLVLPALVLRVRNGRQAAGTLGRQDKEPDKEGMSEKGEGGCRYEWRERRAGEAKKGNRGRNRTSHHLISDQQPVGLVHFLPTLGKVGRV
jgi:hypothetical protein